MLNFVIILFAVALIVVGYALALRPILHRIPQFREFYDEADGFWSKVWAYCGKSATVLWSYILGGVGFAFPLLDQIGPLIGDPDLNLQQKVVDALKEHPQIAGWIVLAFGLITLFTRLRSLAR
ncbi:hypothetical protein [Bradyrhizobium cenepequi]